MDKEKRKKLLIEMMQEDEKYGMYEQSHDLRALTEHFKKFYRIEKQTI